MKHLKLRIPKLKNILVNDIVNFEYKDGEHVEANIINDGYISDNMIHVFDLQLLWSSIRGDIKNENIIIKKRAKWLYENSTIEKKGIIRKERRKKTLRKLQRKRNIHNRK